MSTGPHARRATGLPAAEREESFTRTESAAKWSREGRAAYEAVRKILRFDFFFMSGARCSIHSGRKQLHERGRDFFFFLNFSGSFSLFLRCGGAVLCFVFRTSYRKKKISTLPRVCTYVRHAAFGLFSWMEHGAL